MARASNSPAIGRQVFDVRLYRRPVVRIVHLNSDHRVSQVISSNPPRAAASRGGSTRSAFYVGGTMIKMGSILMSFVLQSVNNIFALWKRKILRVELLWGLQKAINTKTRSSNWSPLRYGRRDTTAVRRKTSGRGASPGRLLRTRLRGVIGDEGRPIARCRGGVRRVSALRRPPNIAGIVLQNVPRACCPTTVYGGPVRRAGHTSGYRYTYALWGHGGVGPWWGLLAFTVCFVPVPTDTRTTVAVLVKVLLPWRHAARRRVPTTYS